MFPVSTKEVSISIVQGRHPSSAGRREVVNKITMMGRERLSSRSCVMIILPRYFCGRISRKPVIHGSGAGCRIMGSVER